MELEQKRKRLDQPRANKTLLNRRCFCLQFKSGLNPRGSQERDVLSHWLHLHVLCFGARRLHLLSCAYPQYRNFIIS